MANALLFPVTVVGSWPRSTELVRALRRKEAGEITLDEFNAIADGEVLACIRAQEEAGVDIVSDGELRRDNFYSFAVDKLNGMQLMKVSELPGLLPGPGPNGGDAAGPRRAVLCHQEPHRG